MWLKFDGPLHLVLEEGPNDNSSATFHVAGQSKGYGSCIGTLAVLIILCRFLICGIETHMLNGGSYTYYLNGPQRPSVLASEGGRNCVQCLNSVHGPLGLLAKIAHKF